jgi:methylated-DNA-[protein]-cysteine S-methyltransferase
LTTRHTILTTPELGDLTLVAVGPSLVGVYFPGHWTLPDPAVFGERVELEDDPVLARAAGQLREFLRGERTEFDLDTAAHGSAFERRVWALLNEIPFGETTTYGDLADELGDRTLARRVGQAVGRNPLSIVVGCHRVLGKDGELRGYAGGIERKQFLLALEGRPVGAAMRLFELLD